MTMSAFFKKITNRALIAALTSLLVTLGAAEVRAEATRLCEVEVCNKLERFTLSPWNTIKDKIGETCFDAVLSERDAKPGKELTSETRWYQGSSINPTKKSVTRVKRVHRCFEPAGN